MLRSGVAALAHLRREYPRRLPHVLRQRRVLLDELGRELVVEAEHVVQDEHLAVARRAGADADRGNRQGLGDLRRQRRGDELQHHGEGAGVLQCSCIGLEPPRRRIIAALHAVAAQGVHRLWRKPEVPHDGDADVDQAADRRGHRLSAFDLHRVAACLLHRPTAIAQGVFLRDLITQERHVADHHGALRAASHHLRVIDHLIQRRRQRGGRPRQDLIQRIAHEQDVDAARVEQPREQGVVTGERDDALAFFLHLDQRPRGDASHVCLPARRFRDAKIRGSAARDGESSGPAPARFGFRSARCRDRACAGPSARAAPCRARLRWSDTARAARRAAGSFPAGPFDSNTAAAQPGRWAPFPRRSRRPAGACPGGRPGAPGRTPDAPRGSPCLILEPRTCVRWSGYATLAKPRVRSRSMVATCSRSRVARSRSVSPSAACTARVATSSASTRFCPAMLATALMRARSRSNATFCSPAAVVMRPACAVASAVAATIASSASSAAADSSSTSPTLTCPRRICSTTSPTCVWMSWTSSPASAAAVALCSARRRTSSATTANPLPCFPARAASIAAFNDNRFVMSASSRIDAINPVMRRLIAPRCWTLIELSPTKVFRATSRSIASRICVRLRLATSLAAVEARAAPAPSSDTRRETCARLSVASSPPDTSPSSRRTPSRITPVDCATAAAAPFNVSAVWAIEASWRVIRSTVSTSGRRRSVMWTAVASWLANVVIVRMSCRR